MLLDTHDLTDFVPHKNAMSERLANFGKLFNSRLLACDWDEQEMSNVSGSCECYSHILKSYTYQRMLYVLLILLALLKPTMCSSI